MSTETYKHDNIIVQHGKSTTITKSKDMTKDGLPLHVDISEKDKFKITVIINNIITHYYKCYKVTIDQQENDKLLTIYHEVTRITSNIELPSNREMLIIVNDSFW